MANIDKLHKQLEADSKDLEIEIEVIEEESPLFSLTPEEWEEYKQFEANKGNILVYLKEEK